MPEVFGRCQSCDATVSYSPREADWSETHTTAQCPFCCNGTAVELEA
jgi:hypothetical protein